MKFAVTMGVACLIVLLGPSGIVARQGSSENGGILDCRRCHTCDVPTALEPCLMSCPRDQMVHQTSKHELREAPDSLLLDQLSDMFFPVHFGHKLHAQMAEMGKDCATCHHFSPPGEIPPCRECHLPDGKSDDLSKPNLKGAYHRQCLSCHREWSHDTKCVVCHTPRKDEILAAVDTDPTDIIGKKHPAITTPVKKVYTTEFKEGPIVTFQHGEHVDLFGFRCVDCHRDESCGNCHDIQKTRPQTRTQGEVHVLCDDCHGDASCDKCHSTMERPGFTHNQTGWPLTPYHQSLECWSCHPAGRRISRLSRMCINCHADWTQDNFRHAVTGMVLDELHSQLDCTACHTDLRYDKAPTCSDCHDDGRSSESAPPGIRQHPAQY
jgi:hypothetical protein